MNWLQSLLYGVISGFAEFLPISAEAHRGSLRFLMGVPENPLLELSVHLGALLALLLSCWPQLSKLQRERRIAAMPPRRRKRQPDQGSLKDLRFLKTAAMPMLVGFILLLWTNGVVDQLWLTALFFAVNGVLLYLPPYFIGGNKDAQSVSGLDAVLVGLSAVFGVIPGISRLTGITTAGLLRRCDRRYILDIGLLLSIPALMVLVLLDVIGLFTVGTAASGGLVVSCLLSALTAFLSAYMGITFIRFLSVKAGFSGFAYYSWGAALFTFILYLTI